MAWLKKLSLVILVGSILGFIVYQVEPPKSWGEATLIHWVLFYIPLLILLTSVFNLLLKQSLKSLVLAIGVILLIILQGFHTLTILNGPFVIIGIFFILRSLKTSANPPKHNRSLKLVKLRKQ